MKTAILIGATGLVGSHVLDRLMTDRDYERVKVFSRRSTGRKSDKLEEHIIDFDRPESWRAEVTGDVLFSAMGTTLKQAGSKEAQYTIDYTYQYEFAKAAAENGVSDYVLVSSPGASPDSSIFYSRMKGELERDVKKLNFKHIHLIQPGILAGQRTQSRLGESIGVSLMSGLTYVPGLTAYRPIHGDVVARAMIQAVKGASLPQKTYTLGDVFALAGA